VRRDRALSVAAVRRITTTIALALCLLGCSSAVPSGEPIENLPGYGSDMNCQHESGVWIDAWLRADVAVHDPLLNTSRRTATALEFLPLDTGLWPQPAGLGYPVQFVQAAWPSEYTGVRLARGEVAVLDRADDLVATTGSKYRLKGVWVMAGAVGGPLFGRGDWIAGFHVCGGSGSAIPL
jgi:hypothetical protein